MDETKGERRERRRRKPREMKVVGRSVRVLQDIIRRRADKLKGEVEMVFRPRWGRN